uniref:Uncharacterized protein n=1 Tax=Anguilla anguilla TaxID=7936 RepID=A0A0E9VWS9_ANGAN
MGPKFSSRGFHGVGLPFYPKFLSFSKKALP